MKGLIIRLPWIDLILSHKKTWEIRGSNTTIRGQICLIQSGTGMIIGTCDLIDSRILTADEYHESFAQHQIPDTKNRTLPYKKIYAWEIANATRLKEPIPYIHPQGAVIWVNCQLSDLEVQKIRQAS